MINKTFFYTSLFSALFMALSLRFLQLFTFIEWSPIGWADKWPEVDSSHSSIKWVLLFLGLFIIFAILYILSSFLGCNSTFVIGNNYWGNWDYHS